MENLKIFRKIGISEINMRLFENFQNLIALQVWFLGFTKYLSCLQTELLLGKLVFTVLGAKVCKDLPNTECRLYLM